mgnify:CR=1 FL=1
MMFRLYTLTLCLLLSLSLSASASDDHDHKHEQEHEHEHDAVESDEEQVEDEFEVPEVVETTEVEFSPKKKKKRGKSTLAKRDVGLSRADPLAAYMKDVQQYRLLTRDEERVRVALIVYPSERYAIPHERDVQTRLRLVDNASEAVRRLGPAIIHVQAADRALAAGVADEIVAHVHPEAAAEGSAPMAEAPVGDGDVAEMEGSAAAPVTRMGSTRCSGSSELTSATRGPMPWSMV